MKKFSLFLKTSAFGIFIGLSTSATFACGTEYFPVCGEKNGVRLTYQNLCTMQESGASFVDWDPCPSSTFYNGYGSYPQEANNSYNTSTNNASVSNSNSFNSSSNTTTNNNNSINNSFNTWNTFIPVSSAHYWDVNSQYCSGDYQPVCAIKNGEYITYANQCYAEKNNATIMKYEKCQETQICPYIQTVYCQVGETYINPGKDSNGCQIQPYCQNEYSSYNYQENNQSYSSSSQNAYYYQIENQNAYNYYGGEQSYQYLGSTAEQGALSNDAYFTISRLKTSRVDHNVILGNTYTLTIFPQSSSATVVHRISSDIQLLQMRKGSCDISYTAYDTVLNCRNNDTIQYTARFKNASSSPATVSTSFNMTDGTKTVRYLRFNIL